MKTKNTTKTTAIKPKKIKIMGPLALDYELISFSVKATIPTMIYGNIIPEIVVKTRTIEEARNIVLPYIEELFTKYADKPFTKANVTVEERKVETPIKPAQPEAKKAVGVLAQASAVAPTTPKKEVEKLAEELAPGSPAFKKASSAINSATSIEAIGLIEDQIQKSVKLSPEEKPLLFVEILKKRKEL